MERREHRRYCLQLPVIFAWRDAGKAQHEALGLTRDISIKGAFVTTTTPPALGTNVKLKALVPIGGRIRAPFQIFGEGCAVRVEAIQTHEGPEGFALAAKRLVLRSGEKGR